MHEPKNGEIWRTQEDNLVLIVDTYVNERVIQQMVYFDKIDHEFCCVDILNALKEKVANATVLDWAMELHRINKLG